MSKVIVNNKKEYNIDFDNALLKSGSFNGEAFKWDVSQISENTFHILFENRSFTVEVLEKNMQEKKFQIKVNGNKYVLEVKDKYDELLKLLGMDIAATGKVNEVKAPMPGLVLDVLVKEGAHIKQGDSLLVLEAMKMENILKASSDAVVKKINVNKRMAVEKNQVLITFE